MGFVLTLLAIPAFFVAPISGWVAFGFYREGDATSAVKAIAVCAAAVFIIIAAPKSKTTQPLGGDCYIDWDGRSNPTVCD